MLNAEDTFWSVHLNEKNLPDNIQQPQKGEIVFMHEPRSLPKVHGPDD